MKIPRREFLISAGRAGAGAAALAWARPLFGRTSSGRKPNVILILADDLGYSQLGCYGEKKIRTPAIDGLAARGVRFTDAYSGSPVCAPSRCVLMTGVHSGHAQIRDNLEIEPEGQGSLAEATATLPALLKREGYATGAVGKWGLGFPGSSGEPGRQGFDFFFGFNCQRRAHNHYPKELWRNTERITLEGNDGGQTGKTYAPDLFEREALAFIREKKDVPFFLFFATTVPHLALQVPNDSLAEYRGLWPETPYDGKNGYQPQPYPRAAYAAMVSRFDRSVGRMLALLKTLDLERDTVVLFASDNGETFRTGGYDPEFFRGSGPFRDKKGSVYEGGIRVPLIVSWPGRVRPGRTTDHVCAFQDILPTLLAAAGARVPSGIDGRSFLPVLTESGTADSHPHFYMEFSGYGGQQMVRIGKWKAVRRNLQKNPEAAIELYDLQADVGEAHDVAVAHPDLVERALGIMRMEHRPSKEFPFPALDSRG